MIFPVRVLLAIFLMFSMFSANAQYKRVAKAEYFWDNDPGQGSGTSIAATNGSFNQAFENISQNISNLPGVGVHKLFIRSQDSTGNWGPLFNIVVQQLGSSTATRQENIAAGEYFWDNDPGEGSGNPLIATDGNFDNAFEAISQSNIGLPSVGTHTLNIRAKEATGNWGPVFKIVEQILDNSTSTRADNVKAAEYFWDNDPGQGNGSAMAAFDGNFDNAFETISQNNVGLPSVGVHTLNIRAKDIAGNWGPVFTIVKEILDNSTSTRADNVKAAEYFWDNDPGQGNGNSMVAFDGNFNQAFEDISQNNVGLPSVGAHTLNIRTKDVAGNWGPVFTVVMQVLNNLTSIRADKVIAAEYFWDNDPGQGSANPMTAFDGNFNSAFETISQSNIGLPSVGAHTLNIRAKEVAGNWGPVFTVVVDVQNTSAAIRNAGVMSAEYFFDSDPGPGNATPMLAQGGNFSGDFQDLLGAAIPAPVTQGIHLLSMRSKDIAGNWGPVFSIVVNIDTTLGAPNVNISGSETLCSNNIAGNVYSTPLVAGSTYTWSITGGSITAGGGTNSVTVTWNSSGPYKLKVKGCDNSGNACSFDSIIPVIIPVVTSTVSKTVCQGVTFAGYSSTGTYVDTFNAANGCDSIRTLNLTVLPLSLVTVEQTVCFGHIYLGHNQSGTYIDTFNATNGCDSIRTLNLTVLNKDTVTVNQSICTGESYLGHTNTGTYIDTFTAVNGCDSIRTLHLTVLQVSHTTVTESICYGESYGGHGASGNFVDTLTGANGCDSIRTLNLTVMSLISTTQNKTVCYGHTYQGHSATGAYSDTLTASNGCDSINILNLTVLEQIAVTINQSICLGQSYAGHTTTGSYVDIYTSVNGCDSTRTLNLTAASTVNTTVNKSICHGDAYYGYTSPGTYIDTLSAAGGCDSIRTLYLTMNAAIRDTITHSICQGDIFEGHTTTSTYTDSLTTVGGCDSFITLKLIVHPSPAVPTITRFGNTLVSSSATYYQWFRDSVALTGDTEVAIVITTSGHYQVEVSDSFGCSSRSAVFTDTTLGVNNIINNHNLSIFPNPTTGQVNITLSENSNNEPVSIKVWDMIGQTIISETETLTGTKINLQLDLSSFAQGVYLLQVKQGNWSANTPIVLTK